MRLYPTLLVAATFVSACANATSTATTSTFQEPTFGGHVPQRFLRVGMDANEDERAPQLVPEQLLGFMKTSEEAITFWQKIQLLKMKITKPSADDAFNTLKLGELVGTRRNLLSSKRFAAWFIYVMQNSETEKEAMVTMAGVLVRHYGDDGGSLVKILEALTKVPATEKIATKLQDRWLKYMLSKGIDDKEVLKLFQINEHGDIEPLCLRVLDKYMTLKPGKDAKEATVVALLSHYKDNHARLVRTLETAIKEPTSKDIGNKLLDEWVTYLGKRKLTEDKVLQLLQSGGQYSILDSVPSLKAWDTAISERAGEEMVAALALQYKDNQIGLVKKLDALTKLL